MSEVAVSDCLFLVIVNRLPPLLIAEQRERREANTRSIQDSAIFVYIYIYLSALALHKTAHTLHKSYHVDPLCIALRHTGCSLRHHFEESPFR